TPTRWAPWHLTHRCNFEQESAGVFPHFPCPPFQLMQYASPEARLVAPAAPSTRCDFTSCPWKTGPIHRSSQDGALRLATYSSTTKRCAASHALITDEGSYVPDVRQV